VEQMAQSQPVLLFDWPVEKKPISEFKVAEGSLVKDCISEKDVMDTQDRAAEY
jgi:hypothetical protein